MRRVCGKDFCTERACPDDLRPSHAGSKLSTAVVVYSNEAPACIRYLNPTRLPGTASYPAGMNERQVEGSGRCPLTVWIWLTTDHAGASLGTA